MVFVKTEQGGYYEPPYSWEEQRELYQRLGSGPSVIVRQRAGPQPSQESQSPPQEEEPRS